MDFQIYLERVARRKAIHESERMGQVYFNQLAEDRPDIANEVRGDYLLDPFYNDSLIGQFLVFVHGQW